MRRVLIILGIFFTIQLFAVRTFANDLSEDSSTVHKPIKMTEIQVFTENKKFGLKNKSGEILLPAQYKKLIRLGNTSWIAQKKNKFGIMTSEGEFLVPAKYRHADRLFGSYAKLGNDNDYGLYNEYGETIIPPEYTSIDPLFGKKFLTRKNFLYGIVDFDGKELLANEFQDIYMPTPKTMRIKYNGDWFEIEKAENIELELPDNVRQIKINDNNLKITYLVANTGIASGYSVVTATDYTLKLFSSISPAYEQTIDELMLSQGAETVSIFIKLAWLPKFPFTYAKKYYQNVRNPYNGPLTDVKSDLKKKM